MASARSNRNSCNDSFFENFPHTQDGRVIVVDPRGFLIADSLGSANLGERFATVERPELQQVLRDQRPVSEIRFSDTLGQSILVAAAPILDESTFYGVVRHRTLSARCRTASAA